MKTNFKHSVFSFFFLVHVDVVAVDTFPYLLHSESTAHGVAEEFCVHFVVAVGFGGSAFALQQWPEHTYPVCLVDVVESFLHHSLVQMFQPQSLFYLAPSPFVVFQFVVDKGPGIATVVNISVVDELFHYPFRGVGLDAPTVHFLIHFVGAVLSL